MACASQVTPHTCRHQAWGQQHSLGSSWIGHSGPRPSQCRVRSHSLCQYDCCAPWSSTYRCKSHQCYLALRLSPFKCHEPSVHFLLQCAWQLMWWQGGCTSFAASGRIYGVVLDGKRPWQRKCHLWQIVFCQLTAQPSTHARLPQRGSFFVAQSTSGMTTHCSLCHNCCKKVPSSPRVQGSV